MKQKGFTLIELMIVVCIVAILAAIVAPALIGSHNEKRSNLWPEYRGGLTIYTDPDTGCQYIQGTGDRMLTPRLGSDGKQLCQ